MGAWQTFKESMGLAPVEQRSTISFQSWLDSVFTFNGQSYPMGGGASITGTTEAIAAGFAGYVAGAYQSNGVVFACIAARMLLFSEARFQFRRFTDGRPGDYFGSKALVPLHVPWTGGTTGDLLSMMELDVSMGGNAFVYRRSASRLVRLRPDWVTIILGGPNKEATMWDLDAEVLGYIYKEGGPGSSKEPVVLEPNVVAHYMPYPDPLAPRRGMSWLTPVIREIQSDSAYTDHKGAYVENGAAPKFVMEYDVGTALEVYNAMVDSFDARHAGAMNAGKTLHLLGAHAATVGSNLQQMDFKSIQGAGETRIAAAAGMHPVIVGLSEGLQGSSLNTGNFAAARRLTADKTLRPLWRNAAGSLAQIIDVPAGAELTVDPRDIAFLREDSKDAAEIAETNARTVTTYVNAGYEPKSVVAALTSDDLTKLNHSGLLSVQLQPPGTVAEPATKPDAPPVDPTSNGKKPVDTLTAP